ncbi:MAG: cytochrome c nitrite reductase small subunit [Ignavibacteriales bacterium]|nr:cytochrome c nitrite reductase small subunit [Ignavibacteriales bacterium]
MLKFLRFVGRHLLKLLDLLVPPEQWKLPVLLVVGVLCGLGLVILHTSNAASYLSDEPAACMNCHVMAPQYATWQRGSHGRFTVCNDCHVPQNNVIRKFAFKANDGLRHSFMFTFRLEPQVIHVKEAGITVLQENCIRCHANLVNQGSLVEVTGENAGHGAGKLCWECHRETPHGRVNSLASVPYARVPRLSPVLPPWIEARLSRSK